MSDGKGCVFEGLDERDVGVPQLGVLAHQDYLHLLLVGIIPVCVCVCVCVRACRVGDIYGDTIGACNSRAKKKQTGWALTRRNIYIRKPQDHQKWGVDAYTEMRAYSGDHGTLHNENIHTCTCV